MTTQRDAGHLRAELKGWTPGTLAARAELASNDKSLFTQEWGNYQIEARAGADTLWLIVRRPHHGALALRAIPAVGPVEIGEAKQSAQAISWRVETASGRFIVELQTLGGASLRLRTTLTPAADLLVVFWPRDLYPLGAGDDACLSEGWVEAAQRGHNTGLSYFTLYKPKFGTGLYVQNLTALNPYFEATQSKPDGVVGGQWPELGYQPPTAPLAPSPPTHPLPKGKAVLISDVLLALSDQPIEDERDSAKLFIELLAELYPYIDKPLVEFRDWPSRADRTLRDLLTSEEAHANHHGHLYLRPYLDAEYPDSMVQLSVLAAIKAYEQAFVLETEAAPLLAAGLGRFFDKELGTLRRYLPNVGDDKDADAVDSWYLYHPLMNLARLALKGDNKAERLLLDSADYAIATAKHFKYCWPIQFNVRDWSVIKAARDEEGFGQTDVGGLYSYLMLQLHELTRDETYIAEAKAALNALAGYRFELAYQTNLTAWGAAACARLWELEQASTWLDQSYVFVANFLHNCELWDSQIAHAAHYPNFFGVTCLHDGPYMAAYECFECFAAFDEYLRRTGKAASPAARMLLSEFRRYTLDRAWFFYPDALPPEAIAKENIRNGRIDRNLSFPLEDVYADGQPAGQVGQEIYGCGGAMIFAALAFFNLPDAPFLIFADQPAYASMTADGGVQVQLVGPPESRSLVRVIKKPRRQMPRISARINDTALAARRRDETFREYEAPANAGIILSWA